MIYEATLQYTGRDNRGNEKTIREKYVLDNEDSFSTTEQHLYNEFAATYDNIDVVDIKRSKIKEIANTRSNDDDLIWLAEMQDIFVDDEGNQKAIKYKIAFYSKNYDTANAFVTEYAKQGYDMAMIGLKLTNFKDVLDY